MLDVDNSIIIQVLQTVYEYCKIILKSSIHPNSKTVGLLSLPDKIFYFNKLNTIYMDSIYY